ncbi:hypothetical protein JKP88DRAFT_327304 [Tribonema minus]|uniref:Uncharacterized protein n=1 Tax=Tribonema minus TaxID=303371 RepID=A0A835YT78_9STRA|nr:hypothetical protein JKP88DRAFT_327304 [Tribonema minus]
MPPQAAYAAAAARRRGGGSSGSGSSGGSSDGGSSGSDDDDEEDEEGPGYGHYDRGDGGSSSGGGGGGGRRAVPRSAASAGGSSGYAVEEYTVGGARSRGRSADAAFGAACERFGRGGRCGRCRSCLLKHEDVEEATVAVGGVSWRQHQLMMQQGSARGSAAGGGYGRDAMDTGDDAEAGAGGGGGVPVARFGVLHRKLGVTDEDRKVPLAQGRSSESAISDSDAGSLLLGFFKSVQSETDPAVLGKFGMMRKPATAHHTVHHTVQQQYNGGRDGGEQLDGEPEALHPLLASKRGARSISMPVLSALVNLHYQPTYLPPRHRGSFAHAGEHLPPHLHLSEFSGGGGHDESTAAAGGGSGSSGIGGGSGVDTWSPSNAQQRPFKKQKSVESFLRIQEEIGAGDSAGGGGNSGGGGGGSAAHYHSHAATHAMLHGSGPTTF